MNYLATVNIGNYISPVVRRRFQSACDRWQCQYFEWTEMVGNEWEGCARFRIPEKIGVDHTILLLDGDMLISKDCPSPFDLCVENDAIYVASAWHGFVIDDPGYRTGAYTLPLETVSRLVSIPSEQWPPIEKFFNSGFAMFRTTQTVLKFFKKMSEVPIKSGWSPDDQAMFNLMLFNDYDIRTIWLPVEWNYFYDGKPDQIHKHFIVHFGGPTYHETLKTMEITE